MPPGYQLMFACVLFASSACNDEPVDPMLPGHSLLTVCGISLLFSTYEEGSPDFPLKVAALE